MKLENVIDEAVRQSKKVRFCFKLGAVVFNKDRIVSAGYNRAFCVGESVQSDCAEVLAIKKAPSQLLDGADLLVCRVRSSGTFGMAKPCPRCQSLIEKVGIRKVLYSTPDGWKSYLVKKGL